MLIGLHFFTISDAAPAAPEGRSAVRAVSAGADRCLPRADRQPTAARDQSGRRTGEGSGGASGAPGSKAVGSSPDLCPLSSRICGRLPPESAREGDGGNAKSASERPKTAGLRSSRPWPPQRKHNRCTISERRSLKPGSLATSRPGLGSQATLYSLFSAKFWRGNGREQVRCGRPLSPLCTCFFLRNLLQKFLIANATGPASSCGDGRFRAGPARVKKWQEKQKSSLDHREPPLASRGTSACGGTHPRRHRTAILDPGPSRDQSLLPKVA